MPPSGVNNPDTAQGKDARSTVAVILQREWYGAWLDPERKDPTRLQELLKPYPAWLMQA